MNGIKLLGAALLCMCSVMCIAMFERDLGLAPDDEAATVESLEREVESQDVYERYLCVWLMRVTREKDDAERMLSEERAVHKIELAKVEAVQNSINDSAAVAAELEKQLTVEEQEIKRLDDWCEAWHQAHRNSYRRR